MTKMWEEICEQPEAIERCLSSNAQVIREVVKAIGAQNINNIYIAARGTSDHAAIYGKYVIEAVVGIPVALAASSIFTIYKKDVSFKNTLVMAISQSGKAADALEVIRSANRQGALTVSITNFPDSPLAQEARFHLCCEAGLEKSVAATKTFTTEMALLALLAAEWGDDDNSRKELSALPQKIRSTLDQADAVKELIPRYRFMDECFVLARGINYPICLEAALKIQETTYVRAKAFATSDFQHGPIAMIDRDIPVIVYAPNGPSLEDMKGIIERLKQDDIDILVVSNNEDVRRLGTCSIAIPETDNDMISPFLNAVAAQMFACNLAAVKGLNPDSPRRLQKVTITK